MREKVTKFDFESAFKELDGLDIPTPEKVTKETNDNFLREKLNKPFFSSDALFEEFYDINDQQDLEEAQEEREDEVAKAKLARIEKIVDLDADSPDELLGSYEGKIIIQCPQCMTKFYKNKEDLEYSEDDPNVVNVNEPCQHCGNISGYDVIGKVAPVDETDEVDLDMEETTEEAPEEGADEMEEVEAEETETEDNGETEEDFDLDFETEEETGEEEANESFYHSSDLWMLTEAFGDDEDEKLADDEDAEIDAELDAAAEADDEETEEETDDEEIEAIDVLTDKLDAEGDEDTVTIAEKGQLENPDAPKLEIEVTEEEGEALADEFCDGEKEFDAEVDKDIEDLEDEEADEEIEEGLDEAIGDEEPVAEPTLGKKMTNLSLNDIFADAMSYLHESLELDAKNEALNESLNEDSKIAQAAKKLLNSKEFKMFDKEGESLDTASVTESCEGEACEEKEEEEKVEECKEELTEDAQEAAYKKASNNIINKLKSDVDAIKAQGDDYVPESIDDIEDIDEESFEECFTEALKAKQENVTGFRISNCYRLNNQLVFEGYALSGDKVLKERHTFTFNENFVANTKKTKMKFKGLNESFNNKSTCNIACAMKQNVLTAGKLLESKTLTEGETIEEGIFDRTNSKLDKHFNNKYVVVAWTQLPEKDEKTGKPKKQLYKKQPNISTFKEAEKLAKSLSKNCSYAKVYGIEDNPENLVCTYIKEQPTKDTTYNRIQTILNDIEADTIANKATQKYDKKFGNKEKEANTDVDLADNNETKKETTKVEPNISDTGENEATVAKSKEDTNSTNVSAEDKSKQTETLVDNIIMNIEHNFAKFSPEEQNKLKAEIINKLNDGTLKFTD